MEDLSIYESRNNNVSVRDKPKLVGMAKNKMKVSERKTLADISNVPHRLTASSQDNKSQPSSDATRKIIEKLQTENAALKTLLSEKDKIIELGGAEVQKLRVNLQKIKQQNQHLAQSNCQILAELNSFKEMQKALKHELGCKNGMIIAKNLELEELAETTLCQANGSNTEKVAEKEETEVSTTAESDDEKDSNTGRKQKIISLVPSARKIQDNDTSKTGRLQTRRQSARFMLDEPKPIEDHLKIDHVDDSPPYHPDDDKVKVNDSCSMPSSSKEEDKEGDSLQAQKPQDIRKTSLSRPVREAAKKVKSYKEISLNVKMRRE